MGIKNRKLKPRKRIKKECLNCKKEFGVIPSVLKSKRFCCKKCYTEYRISSIKLKTKDGLIYSKNCSKGGCNSTPGWKNSNLENEVRKILIKLHIDFIYQKRIKLLNNKYVVVDFLIPNKNIIIEVNGNYWHCNPEEYNSNYYNKKMKKFARDIWKEDSNRINNLSILGYNVNVIWEDEINYSKLLNIIN